MSAQPLSRRERRRLSRTYGVPIAWAHSGGLLTTPDHRHPVWGPGREDHVTGEVAPDVVRLWAYGWVRPRCSMSCRFLFGVDGAGNRAHFMRGECDECGAEPAELHTGSCPILGWCLENVDPDLWPRPVHRPRWVEQLGRARALAVDPDLITGGPALTCPERPPVGGYSLPSYVRSAPGAR